jgi:Zn finger protein HypA/HybF involved in hydrogenase expression
MVIVQCSNCLKEFNTYPCHVKRSKNLFCSIYCKGKWQTTNIVGNNNPNYSVGRENSFCLCGKQKDYRANQCSLCAHKSVPKDKNSIPSKEEIENVIKNSSSFLEASAKISFSRQKLKVLAEEYNIDISHFKKCNNRLYSSEELLTVGGKRINGTVRALILRENLLQYKCALCHQLPFHNEKELTLQLDHINGNPFDNQLENLRFLCPNCHTQTETYTGRNMRIKENSVSDRSEK